MKHTLFIRITKNYGNIVYYPDCTQSKLLANLANTKTLTVNALATIQTMGFKCLFHGEPLPACDAELFGKIVKFYHDSRLHPQYELQDQADYNLDGSRRDY